MTRALRILEKIKKDIKFTFDGDPIIMRTVNMVISEYKFRYNRESKRIKKK